MSYAIQKASKGLITVEIASKKEGKAEESMFYHTMRTHINPGLHLSDEKEIIEEEYKIWFALDYFIRENVDKEYLIVEI